MEDDYYSLTSILADNHKLPCTFTLEVPGLGYLEGGSEQNLQAGAKVELPLWMARVLAQNEFATFTVPQPFTQRVRANLNASAPAVKLSSLVGAGGWWYRFGTAIAKIWDSGDSLLAMLREAFISRLPALQNLSAHHASMDHSSIPEGTAGTGEAFREGMEADERELFNIGQESGRIVKKWHDSSWARR
ncbi:GINS complex, Psf3 component [Cutaneotrichosporon oleaginosum]|uniref:DNA replication complex GINS protein PSF3 n=1 Tax=Cutaneotrichosporon oleaginosum TaxID=879819 RepID=A0A0J0XIK5_9TREE|nr:GINS complex, Psf3 component [Cutaneotrichosporon oleaginosum]KLT40915.1 GINS complex, Psf3 component [Cutaneotrichosporon oleaginosum]TXT15408.1 hypothetical protein COLE_01601 [Cutaneotrichosporon oleaginosum]